MKNTALAILCIGNEVVDGRILNSNAAWLSQEFGQVGIETKWVLCCADDEAEISDALTFLAERVEFIITSGGLGPTSDDLTRQAIAKHLQKDLILSEEELGRLKNRYRKRGRKFDNANSIQAYFPEGSTPIPNPLGTAPGILTTVNESQIIFSLPGVPSELKEMIKTTVVPAIREKSIGSLAVQTSHLFHLFGIPESEAGKRVSLLELPDTVRVGYRPHFPEVEIRLSTSEGEDALKDAIASVRQTLQDFIYSEALQGGLPTALHTLLLQLNKTVAVAESCTSGYLGKLLTNEGGSSAYFLGGALTYSNEMKELLLGVPKVQLITYGAVSPQVAIAMAEGAHQKCKSDIALSITGIAGPDGGSEEKPVGLFYVGIASEGFSTALKFLLPSNREYVRKYAAYAALDTLRRHLLGLPYLGKTTQ